MPNSKLVMTVLRVSARLLLSTAIVYKTPEVTDIVYRFGFAGGLFFRAVLVAYFKNYYIIDKYKALRMMMIQ